MGPGVALLLAALPTAQFVYRAAGLEQRCPTAEQVTEKVAARLGHAPFEPGAARQIHVTIERGAGGFSARVEVETPGQPGSARNLSSASCDELGDSIALVIALVLDPLAAPEVDSPAPPPAAPVVISTPAPAPAPPRWAVELWAGPQLTLGAAPTLAVGGRLGAALALDDRFAFGLEARLQGSPPAATSFGSLSTLSGLGLALVCARWHGLGGCVEGGGGAFSLLGERVASGAGALPVGVAGLRAGYRLRTGPVGVTFELELLVPFNRLSVTAGSSAVWQAAPLSGSLLVSVVIFP